MKLYPRTYSLKQAKGDIESCNRLILSKTEEFVTLKKTLDRLQNSIHDLANKKIYIKQTLRLKAKIVKNSSSRKRINRMLKQ